MSLAFADIEQRINSTVMAKLANTTALCNAVAMDGIFYANSAMLFDRVQTNKPHFECNEPDAILAGAVSGQTMLINAVNYTIQKVDSTAGFVLFELHKS